MFASILILATLPSLAACRVAHHDAPIQSRTCPLRSTAMGPPEVHPDLMAVAAQYFHADYRGGYDAYRSTSDVKSRSFEETVFPWFDVQDLTEPVIPPAGVRVVMKLRDDYFVARLIQGMPCCESELGLWNGHEQKPRWLGLRSFGPDSAVQARDGRIWAIMRRTLVADQTPPIRLLQIDAHGKVGDVKLDVANGIQDAELVLTAEDRPALVFLRRDEARLGLWLSWSLDPGSATQVDGVQMTGSMAELSARSNISLAVAADGSRGIAIAWRPLTDRASDGPGERATSAEVRWLIVEPDGRIDGPRSAETTAEPSMWTTGRLTGNGMQAGTMAGHAFFAWRHGMEIVGVRSSDKVPTSLAPTDSADTALQLRTRTDDVELILLRSSPAVRAFSVHCRIDADGR
ncbi:MAG: hypothetical protein EOO81_04620 [Oxalobacteraceae bacterium]|nr:MAG: hypothetical protein EOO81_04620 [Oxalobacteraceae bacterium]